MASSAENLRSFLLPPPLKLRLNFNTPPLNFSLNFYTPPLNFGLKFNTPLNFHSENKYPPSKSSTPLVISYDRSLIEIHGNMVRKVILIGSEKWRPLGVTGPPEDEIST